MTLLQQVEPAEQRTSLRGKRKLSDFNFRDPDFNDHDPEFLAYMENAPIEEKEETLDAALSAARAQIAAGYVIRGSFEDVRRWLREGRSLEYVLQASRAAENTE